MPTIAAIATPPGNGGIGIIRVSGPGAKNLLARVFLPHSSRFSNFRPWTMHRGVMLDANDEPLDDVLAVYMPAPRTYTGEEMAEIHCHGGAFLVEAALESLLRLGARIAEPGEFTRRAFLNGRMELTQAEAVAEMIAAPSREALKHGFDRLEGRIANRVRELRDKIDDLRAAARLGVDFPDDEIESLNPAIFCSRLDEITDAIQIILKGAARARVMREGALIALVGPVNAGKSSLLNALCGRNRAIVSCIPGTTRDFIEERLDLEGLPTTLVDTAGVRGASDDPVEALGIARTREIIDRADLVALVMDSANPCPVMAHIPAGKTCLRIWNKCDLARPAFPADSANIKNCRVSALTGENLDGLAGLLRAVILEQSGAAPGEMECAPNTRQALALKNALVELSDLQEDINAGLTYDCWLARLDAAAESLGEIMGFAANDELLDRIFSQFCIGK